LKKFEPKVAMLGNLARVDQGAALIALPSLSSFVGYLVLVFAVVQDNATHQPLDDGSHRFFSAKVCFPNQDPFIGETGFHFCECDGFHFAFFFAKLQQLQGKLKVQRCAYDRGLESLVTLEAGRPFETRAVASKIFDWRH
jgi:hypothetical protein